MPGFERARFGPFEVDHRAGEVRRDGRPVPIQDLPFRLLVTLLQAPNQVVGRDELCRALWGDTVVEYEAGLNTAVRKLRDALGDDPAAPQYIETVPRRGYRFRGTVASGPQVPAAVSTVETHLEPAVVPAGVGAGGRTARWLAAMSIAIAAVVLVARVGREPSADGQDAVRLVVLPVAHHLTSSDSARDDGLTDLLIAHLARLDPPHLVVLGPVTSRAIADAAARHDALLRSLDVALVLSTSIDDSAGARLAVTLTRFADGRVVWSDVFGPSGTLSPDQWSSWVTSIGRGVAGALGRPATDTVVARASTLKQDAFEAYLRAWAGWARFDADGLETAVKEFTVAIERDPGFVTAHVGLADALNLRALFRHSPPRETFDAAVAAASQALRLAPDDPGALAALALARLYSGRDLNGARDLFDRALAREPGRALTHQWAAGAFSAAGQHDRALAMARRAQLLDPLSPSVNSDLCWYAYFARRFEDAAAHAEHAFESFGQTSALQCAQLAYWQLGDVMRERDALVRHLAATNAADASDVIRAFAGGGVSALRAANVARLEASNRTSDDYARIVANVAAGAVDRAAELLLASDGGDAPWRVFVHIDPSFDALRADSKAIAPASKPPGAR